MATQLPPLTNDERRALAAGLFNEVWKFLEKTDRSAADDEAMLHAAHASRYFWGAIGTVTNFARGDWLLARVYAVLGRAEPALHHATACLSLCTEGKLKSFDLAFAHEALARAAAVAGDSESREKHLAEAREIGASISDATDREWLLQNLATIR